MDYQLLLMDLTASPVAHIYIERGADHETTNRRSWI